MAEALAMSADTDYGRCVELVVHGKTAGDESLHAEVADLVDWYGRGVARKA